VGHLQMQEQTSEMMRDDDSLFVRVTFKQHLSKSDLRIFLAKVGISPAFLDHQKMKCTLRFESKTEAEHCVKVLMDAKWKEQKKPKMFKALTLEGSCEKGVQAVATIVNQIEMLTAE
jgi:hypothetical protein